MWKATPAKSSSRLRGGGRRSGAGDDGRKLGKDGTGGGSGDGRSLASSISLPSSQPPPRLAPLSSPSEFAPSTSSATDATRQRKTMLLLAPYGGSGGGGGGGVTRPRRPSRPSHDRLDPVTDVPLGHTAPAASRERPPARLAHRFHHRSGNSNNSRSGDAAASTAALWRTNVSHPPPPPLPHLAALSVTYHPPRRRSRPVELSRLRGRPLTRRLTTTLTGASTSSSSTLTLPKGTRRQSRSCSEGKTAGYQAPSASPPPPPPPLPRTHVAAVNATARSKDTDASGSTENRVNSEIQASEGLVSSHLLGSATPCAEVASNEPAVVPPACASECDGSAVTGAAAAAAAAAALEDEAVRAVDVSTDATASSSGSESQVSTSASFAMLYGADTPQPDYALTHHLPQLFTEMVRDLAAAEPLLQASPPLSSFTTATAETAESDVVVVEQWIQRWFCQRYDRAHVVLECASSPSTQRARCSIPRGAATPRADDFLFARSGEPRRSKQNSVAPSLDSAVSSAMSSASSNRWLVPLMTPPAGTVMATATSFLTAAAAADDTYLCASLNSAHCDSSSLPSPSLSPSLPLPPVPPPISATASKSAIVAGPPTNASGGPQPQPQVSRSPRPTPPPSLPPSLLEQHVSTGKRSSGSAASLSGAAVNGPRRGPATSSCAIVGLLSSVSAPEAGNIN
ncbi:hypothetical protein NQL31_002534 [Lotmaria passim]